MGSANPFQPGARIAIVSYGWSDPTYREDRVLKVHKTGRFTLAGRPTEQWRPQEPGSSESRWSAVGAGGRRWDRETLYAWDTAMNAEVAEAGAKRERAARWRRLREQVEAIRADRATDALIEAVEAALLAFQTERDGQSDPSPLPLAERRG